MILRSLFLAIALLLPGFASAQTQYLRAGESAFSVSAGGSWASDVAAYVAGGSFSAYGRFDLSLQVARAVLHTAKSYDDDTASGIGLGLGILVPPLTPHDSIRIYLSGQFQALRTEDASSNAFGLSASMSRPFASSVGSFAQPGLGAGLTFASGGEPSPNLFAFFGLGFRSGMGLALIEPGLTFLVNENQWAPVLSATIALGFDLR